MPKTNSSFVPRGYHDVPTVEPTIKKEFKPYPPGGTCASRGADALEKCPVQFKCYTCGGVRVYGDGNPSKARYGFIGKTFYFCHGCGEVLTLENRAADMKKIALRIR